MKKSEVSSKLARISLISMSIFYLMTLLVSVICSTFSAFTPPLLITSWAMSSYSCEPLVPAYFNLAK
jgi:hypothetical protein